MRILFQLKNKKNVVLLFAVFIAIAAGVICVGGGIRADVSGAPGQSVALSDSPSYEPSAEVSGEMCQWVPVNVQARPAAMLGEQEKEDSKAASGAAPVSGKIDVAPVRILRDTYPSYSAVAVDNNSNEVYLQDENLFGYKVFNRLDNTPPTANFTEPKRVVGGPKTNMQFNCSLYVDPKSGDVYSVTNDFVDTLTVFSRDARGDVPPKRELFTPHRTWGIAVDEQREELYLTVEYPPSIVVYRKYAEKAEKPLRRLAGSQTRLADPHGIALDTKNGLMFVSNHGATSDPNVPGSGKFDPPSITVYPWKAAGDTPPVRVIQGAKTQLNWPSTLFVDEERGEVFVANDAGNSILVFRTTDEGDVAPIRMIKGPKTELKAPTGLFVDLKNQELWVASMGNRMAMVYPLTADGDVAPKRTIRSAPAGLPGMNIGNPGSVGYDSKREEILVPN